jgi:sphingomyelin phosphodiesterase
VVSRDSTGLRGQRNKGFKILSILIKAGRNIFLTIQPFLKAHIIGHINPAGCMSSWSFNYYRIVNRYESTIVGQFFGHTHNDEFEIFYDLDNPTRPTGIAWVTGSVTTQPQVFPSYRIYTVDGPYSGASYWVLDHENTILNITDANLTNEPKWVKEYSAKVSLI